MLTAIVFASGALWACSGDSTGLDNREAARQALENLLARGPQVYVLGRIEEQRTEPLITYDHLCADGIRHMSTLRDSITLRADGTARRATRSERLHDSTVVSSSYRTDVGGWEHYGARGVSYYEEGPSIEATLGTENSIESRYKMPFRLRGTDTLVNVGSLGGVCPGSIGDPRTAEFFYTRR